MPSPIRDLIWTVVIIALLAVGAIAIKNNILDKARKKQEAAQAARTDKAATGIANDTVVGQDKIKDAEENVAQAANTYRGRVAADEQRIPQVRDWRAQSIPNSVRSRIEQRTAERERFGVSEIGREDNGPTEATGRTD